MQPKLRLRREGQLDLPVLCWRSVAPQQVVASSPHGGGLGLPRRVADATVPASSGARAPRRPVAGGRGAGDGAAVDRHHGAPLGPSDPSTDPADLDGGDR